MTHEPVLSTRVRNRALLARQLLLARSRLPIPRALEQLAGIQNQYAPNAYLRLWSCLDGFRRDDLTRAYEDGSVVQGTLMRGTIHAVSAADYHPLLAAIRATRREWARRIHRDDGDDGEALVARVRAALRGTTLGRSELLDLRGDATASAWQTIDTDAELLRVPPSGTWERRRADRFGLADDVIGGHDEPDEADALAHLVRRYLGGFGPAAPKQIADFAGVPVTTLKPVLAAMELRRFRDEANRLLLDVPDGPLPDPDAAAPVRFLPTWDATLLVHARPTGILPEEYRPRIFHTKAPHSYNTFLVDGRVAGTWRFDEGRIELTPFRELTAVEHDALEEETAALAAFHAASRPVGAGLAHRRTMPG